MVDDSDKEGLKVFKRIEKELQTCLASRYIAAGDHADHATNLLSNFCRVGLDIILQDFDLANRNKVEDRMWDIHGKLNVQFRKEFKLSHHASAQRKTVKQRVLEKSFIGFIKSSQRFYRGFIQSLGSRFNGVRQLEAVANRLTLSTLSVEEPVPATDELERLVLLSCHQNLIRLGDLSRWRETQLETKERNWGPAIGYYDLAGRVHPASGASHNQLAVIALQDSNHLGAVYHLYLAWAAEDPHPNARDNLRIEFKKIEEIWDEGGIARLKMTPRSQRAVNDIAALFACLHAYCFKGKRSWEQEGLENRAFESIGATLRERSIDQILCKIVLVNIAAEYFAVQELRKNPESSIHLQSFVSAQRLNLGTFSALLQLLESELERHMNTQVDARGSPKGGDAKLGPEKISVVARRVLPALRHYSSWLLANSTIMMANNDAASSAQVRVLWTAYTRTLTLLATIFSWKELNGSALDYLLDEDETTVGFTPFKHKNVNRRYLKDDGISQKPRHHERDPNTQRQNGEKETLGRVRDLLLDGTMIQSREGIPITAVSDNRRLAYLDGNKTIELHGQAHFSSTTSEQEQTTQVNRVALSSTAFEAGPDSTMDIDKERMVDDLVNPVVGEKKDDAIDCVSARVTQSAEKDKKETSYGLIGRATALEHFGEQPIGARRHSRPFLPSIEESPFAPRPGEEQILASPRIPIIQSTPTHSGQCLQNMAPIIQQSNYVGILSSKSSMPTPTFQNTQPDHFPAIAGHHHPNVHKNNVQKALDETVFRSSNVFPGSTSGNTQSS